MPNDIPQAANLSDVLDDLCPSLKKRIEDYIRKLARQEAEEVVIKYDRDRRE